MTCQKAWNIGDDDPATFPTKHSIYVGSKDDVSEVNKVLLKLMSICSGN